MPGLALALCLFWFVSLFVVRSLLQLRRTGSTGIKGFHGRIGSPPWIAGVTISLGLLLTPLGPLAAQFQWPGGTLFFTNPILHALGAICTLVGIFGALAAQLTMGASWRIGVDERETTELVTSGLFARVRNPIFSFMGLSLCGLVLLVPNPLALLTALLTLLGIEIQVRAVEEPYLRATHGQHYERYAAQVGRFVPGLGRWCDIAGQRPDGVLRG
jgi:protein-S-isoprenylcysteine O-methyltransferase Ste14